MYFRIGVGHIAWITGILLMISWKDFSVRTRLVSRPILPVAHLLERVRR
jgi:hypothetical protein